MWSLGTREYLLNQSIESCYDYILTWFILSSLFFPSSASPFLLPLHLPNISEMVMFDRRNAIDLFDHRNKWRRETKKIVRGWFAKSILRQQWPEKSNKWEEFQEGQRDKCQISFVRSFFFLSFFCFSFFFFFFFVCFTFLCCHHFFSVPEDEDEGKEEHDEAEYTQNQFLSGGTFIFSKKICTNKSV